MRSDAGGFRRRVCGGLRFSVRPARHPVVVLAGFAGPARSVDPAEHSLPPVAVWVAGVLVGSALAGSVSPDLPALVDLPAFAAAVAVAVWVAGVVPPLLPGMPRLCSVGFRSCRVRRGGGAYGQDFVPASARLRPLARLQPSPEQPSRQVHAPPLAASPPSELERAMVRRVWRAMYSETLLNRWFRPACSGEPSSFP